MTNHTLAASIRNDRGIALVLSLFLMTAMSVVAASLMFLSQTEAYSSTNYKLMSQARYGAESGVQKAVNYLLNTYAAPGGAGDPLSNYVMTASPVTYNGNPVILSANDTVTANYPVPAVQTAFAAAVAGSLPAGATNVAFAPYAKLLSMQQITTYGGGMATIQTWEITSTGTITAGKTAQVEVVSVLETQKAPAAVYGVFGTSPNCGALQFGGNSYTDSYDSSTYSGSGGVTAGNGGLLPSHGNVGTNGNLAESGSAVIHGSLSTPRIGVGGCSAGNVDALTSSGNATLDGGVIHLPQAIVMPTPALPSPLPPTTSYDGNNQTLLNGASVGNVTVNANRTLTLCSPNATCTINVNSVKLASNGELKIADGATVILNVAGTGEDTPLDLVGGFLTNTSLKPGRLQIQYAGTGEIKLGGGSQSSALVYAPNAAFSFHGGGDFYGAVVSRTVTDLGNSKIHVDRNLSQQFSAVGNSMMSSFSWKKY